MKRLSVLLSVLVLLVAGCAPAAAPTPAPVTEAPGAAPQSGPSPTAEVAANATPLPSPTPLPPTPTPTPMSKVIGPDNFLEAAPVQSFLAAIEAQMLEMKWGITMWTYSPDGRYLAVGGCASLTKAVCYSRYEDGHVFLYIFDAQTAELIYSLPDEHISVEGLSFSMDGKWLAYAACPLQLRLFNMETLQTERTLWSDQGCASYPKTAISPDGKQIALVSDTRLLVFDLESGRQLTEQLAQRYGAVLPKYSGDGTRLAVFGVKDGSEIFIYDTSTWQRVTRIRVGSEVGPQAVDFSVDGRWVVTADRSDDAPILVWDAVTGEQIAALPETLQWLSALSFSPDGRMLLASGSPRDYRERIILSVWDTASWQNLGVVYSLSTAPDRIMFARDGESFIASDFYAVQRWSLPDADLQAPLLAVRQIMTDLFTALAEGDYERATLLHYPNYDEQQYMTARGFEPVELAAALQSMCERATAPCMPIEEIVFVGQDKSGPDLYWGMLRFRRPDGSTFQTGDGERTFWVTVVLQPDGRFLVMDLPEFFYK